MSAALNVYAPPFENPTEERIKVAEVFIDGLREISKQNDSNKYTDSELQEKIRILRARIQMEFGTRFI